jgi:hypothetical protein
MHRVEPNSGGFEPEVHGKAEKREYAKYQKQRI